MKRLGIVVFAVIMAVAFGIATTSASETATLFTNKCTGCHDASRTCNMLGKKDKLGWQGTTLRMITNGAQLSAAEAEVIAHWLATRPKGAPGVCK